MWRGVVQSNRFGIEFGRVRQGVQLSARQQDESATQMRSLVDRPALNGPRAAS